MKRRTRLMIYVVALSVFCNEVMFVTALEAAVSVDPAAQEVPQVGETFTVNISITNVTNLFGYDFMLWYNTTLLDCLDVTWPTNHFLTPSLKPSNVFKIKTIEDNVNETTGAVRVVTTLLDDEPSKNGTGVLVTITFNGTTTDGPSPLQLYWPGFVYPVKLSDPDGNPIPCTATHGEVTVIPEFHSILMAFVLVLTAGAIAFFKRRHALP